MADNKAQKNAYYDKMAKQQEALAKQYEAESSANQEKITRLQTAKDSLEEAVKEYEKFKENVQKIESEISTSDFQGDIRDDFKKKIDAAVTAINNDINVHEKNSASISWKITQLETANGNLIGMAKNAWDSFWSYVNSKS